MTVICLHGLGRSAADWDGVRSRLAAFGDVVTPEQPGEIDHLIGPGAIVIGHSMGAVAALRLLAHRPRPVRALVLTGCFFRPARNGRGTAAALRDYGAHRVAFLRASRRERARPAGRAAIRPLASLARQALAPEPDIGGHAVLVVHARDDHHVPVDFAVAAARRHPGWALRLLDGGGHHAHVTRPEAWADAVVAWLATPRS